MLHGAINVNKGGSAVVGVLNGSYEGDVSIGIDILKNQSIMAIVRPKQHKLLPCIDARLFFAADLTNTKLPIRIESKELDIFTLPKEVVPMYVIVDEDKVSLVTQFKRRKVEEPITTEK